MAENKKSFIAYCDWIDTFEALPNDKAGELIKHLLRYVNDLNPETDDLLIKAVFANIKRQLKRDLDRYEEKRKQWSDAGKRSAEARKANKKQRTLTNVESRSTDSTVNVNVNDILLDSVQSPPIGVDPLHFYIAKGFYVLFKNKSETKTLKKAKVSKWVDVIRKMIEIDGVTIEQLVAIKYYFELAQKDVRGIDKFWYENIHSIAAFRKSKDDEYYYDKITQKIKGWSSNKEIQAEIHKRTQNLLSYGRN